MIWLIRTIVALTGLLFLFIGTSFHIDPLQESANFFITPEGVAGLNTIRGDIAGMFLAMGVFCLLGLREGAQQWLYAAVIVLAMVASGRLVGFLIDGSTESALTAFVAELVFIVLLVVAALRLKSSTN